MIQVTDDCVIGAGLWVHWKIDTRFVFFLFSLRFSASYWTTFCLIGKIVVFFQIKLFVCVLFSIIFGRFPLMSL